MGRDRFAGQLLAKGQALLEQLLRLHEVAEFGVAAAEALERVRLPRAVAELLVNAQGFFLFLCLVDFFYGFFLFLWIFFIFVSFSEIVC